MENIRQSTICYLSPNFCFIDGNCAGLQFGWLKGADLRAPPHIRNTPKRVSGIGAEGGREGQRQHIPGLRRGDDAVVPQPRGGVIGVALAFVLLADRRP